MEKFFKLIFIFTLLAGSNYLMYSQPPFSGGFGTAIEPYLISNRLDMEELADSVNNSTTPYPNNWSKGKYFALTQDITDSVRTVIGKYPPLSVNPQYTFQGNFNGNGYKITVSINRPTEMYLGIFGVCTDSCVIENLNVDGVIIGSSSIGGIVGSNYSLSNSNESIVKNCNNYSYIKGYVGVGGIVGENSGKITNCNNYGTIDSGYSTIGGIAGTVIKCGNISNCINSGLIRGGVSTGGIVGYAISNATIYNCINVGMIENLNILHDNLGRIGGIIGTAHLIDEIIILNCVNYGFVAGNNFTHIDSGIGGIIGWIIQPKAIISNNSNFGVISGTGEAGCIVGKNNGGANISNNHYDKQMCGE